MHGWRTTARNRAILSTYRGRKKMIWSEEEQQEAQKKYGKNNSDGRTFYDDEEGGPDLSAFELTNREAMAIMKNVSYSDDLAATLNRVSNGFDDSRGETCVNTTTAEDTQQGNRNTDIDFRQYRMRVTPAHHRLAERILEKSAPSDADGQQIGETEDDDEETSVAESTTDAGSEASSNNELPTTIAPIEKQKQEVLAQTSHILGRIKTLSKLRQSFKIDVWNMKNVR